MSFYMATCFSDRVEMLTDGAGYDRSAVLRTITTKVHAVDGHPVAITARGHVGWGKRFVASITDMIQKAGFDVAMAGLGQHLPQYAGQLPRADAVEICVAGVSPSKGAVAYHFRTEEEEGFVQPYHLYDTTESVVCGITHPGHHARILEAGTLRDRGVDFLEMFRADASISTLGLNAPAHVVGGHVDWTVIDASGVRTETIHTWTEDRIGHRISPVVDRAVVPLPALTSKLNRKQRRAAARLSA